MHGCNCHYHVMCASQFLSLTQTMQSTYAHPYHGDPNQMMPNSRRQSMHACNMRELCCFSFEIT